MVRVSYDVDRLKLLERFIQRIEDGDFLTGNLAKVITEPSLTDSITQYVGSDLINALRDMVKFRMEESTND